MSGIKKGIPFTILAAGLFITAVVLFNYQSMVSKGTNVAFQSSDGQWAGREVLMKGHKFENIVVNFEAYKIMCKAPNAVLQRITEKPSWTSPRHYYNDYQDPKWLVPFAEAYEHTKSGSYRPASREHCIHGGISEEKIVEARRRAKSYVARLLSPGISGDETIKEVQRNHK